ncbi:acyltransferase family protein [Ligilactobacillus sp. WC1T17]
MNRTEQNRTERNSWLELLRIISMLFIVMNHYSGEEPWKFDTAAILGQLVSYQIYRPLGQVGVDIFVLITGYFMAGKIDVTYGASVKRALKVWLEVWVYSVLLFVVGSLCFGTFSLSGALKGFFPVIFNNYWFVTAYIMLVLLIPFINRILTQINQKQYVVLLVLSIFFAECLPVVNNTIFSWDKGFGDLLAVYLLGGYIKKYGLRIKQGYLVLIFLVTYTLMLSSIVVLGLVLGTDGNITRLAYGFLPYVAAAAIFLIFESLPAFSNKFINYVAGSVFASYLLTENSNVVATIWKVFDMTGVSNLFVVVVAGIFISLLLIVITVIIDKIRIAVFNLLKVKQRVFALVDKFSAK